MAIATRLRARLDSWLAVGDIDRIVLGFSGGLDSTVLLHLLRDYVAQAPVLLQACHIDHGLQADSARWVAHCARTAAGFGVDFRSERLDGAPAVGASIEDWARQQRYAVLLAQLDNRSALVTAHHRDDQAETVLLHALRGSGPHGLAGIRARGRYGEKRLLRPLLDEQRADLLAYGRAHDLQWVDDPSNTELRFARNRLRAAIMPALEREFPGARAALARVATLQAEVVEVLDALADQFVQDGQVLDLAHLRGCAQPLRPFIVKRWLARAGGPVPGRAQLERMLHEMLDARADAMPLVEWRGVAVRRYDDKFFLTVARLPLPSAEPLPYVMSWTPLRLPQGVLSAREIRGEGAELVALADGNLSLRFRHGGERLRLHSGGPRRALKSLFQEWRVPPWLRNGWPLVFVGEQLALVPGHAVAAEFRVAGHGPGVSFEWQPLVRSGQIPCQDQPPGHSQVFEDTRDRFAVEIDAFSLERGVGCDLPCGE